MVNCTYRCFTPPHPQARYFQPLFAKSLDPPSRGFIRDLYSLFKGAGQGFGFEVGFRFWGFEDLRV